MASNIIVEEEMGLPDDSTVEYLESSMEYESAGGSEYPSSVMSSSDGDSDDSDGLSVDGSGTEEIVTDRDDGNYDNDSWKCTGEDCSADTLLDRYAFSPSAVGGLPRNCIPPDSRPEEYVCMFLGVLPEEIVVDTNIYGRRKFSSKSACPDNHHAWVDITLEEMKAFLGLVVKMSLTRKGDMKEYWSLNPSQAFPFSGKSLLETGSLTYCTLSITLHWKDQYTRSKRFYILCSTLANNTKGFLCLRERFVWMRALLDSKAEHLQPNICRTNIAIVGV